MFHGLKRKLAQILVGPRFWNLGKFVLVLTEVDTKIISETEPLVLWLQKTISIRITQKVIWNLRAMDWKTQVRAHYVAYNTEREASLVIFSSPLNHIDLCWQLDLQDLVLAWLWFVVQMLEDHIKQQFCVSVRRKSSSNCNIMTDARAFLTLL